MVSFNCGLKEGIQKPIGKRKKEAKPAVSSDMMRPEGHPLVTPQRQQQKRTRTKQKKNKNENPKAEKNKKQKAEAK